MIGLSAPLVMWYYMKYFYRFQVIRSSSRYYSYKIAFVTLSKHRSGKYWPVYNGYFDNTDLVTVCSSFIMHRLPLCDITISYVVGYCAET